jgi:SH3-like domain-containing protein
MLTMSGLGKWALATGLALALAGCGEGEATKCRTRSGFPVPRFVTLKSGEVNARNGPGEDHRILWVWRVRGMPLEVVAESRDWRKVRGPDGATAWVKKQLVDGGRSVIRTRPGDLPLRAEPRGDSRIVAYLRSGAVAAQLKAEKGWSRLQAGGVRGWAPQSEVWGGGPEPVCTPARQPRS